MKFFVPGYENAGAAENLLDACARFTNSEIPTSRIYSVSFAHNGKAYEAIVGQPIDSYFQAGGPVFCILKRHNAYVICLHSRGVRSGEPILVGTASVSKTTHFDETNA